MTDRLTPAMLRNLSELAEIAGRNQGEAYWYPAGSGEWRTANALRARGLLKQEFGSGVGGSCFSITEAGYEAASPRQQLSEEENHG